MILFPRSTLTISLVLDYSTTQLFLPTSQNIPYMSIVRDAFQQGCLELHEQAALKPQSLLVTTSGTQKALAVKVSVLNVFQFSKTVLPSIGCSKLGWLSLHFHLLVLAYGPSDVRYSPQLANSSIQVEWSIATFVDNCLAIFPAMAKASWKS